MPETRECVTCGGATFEYTGGDSLGCIDFDGVELKAPRGVWFQKPETFTWHFIKDINSTHAEKYENLPPNTLNWEVDEEYYKNYIKLFGPESMLFSRNEVETEAVHRMGVTRERWMEMYKQDLPNGQKYYPDPILLHAIAQRFWKVHGNVVVAHTHDGTNVEIGWDYLMQLKAGKEDIFQKLKQLKQAFDTELLTEAEYNTKKNEILSEGS